MKFSNRKELLRQSDEVLREIRSDIQKNKLNEELLSNIVNSIVWNVSKWIKTGRQAWLQYKMPYIMGLDLINNKNLKVNRKVLKILDTYIKNIIRDVRNSPELKKIAEEIKTAEREAINWLNILNISREKSSTIGAKSTKSQLELYKRAPIEYEKALKKYRMLLLKKVTAVVENIIRKNSQYKNFDKIVLSVLKSGIQGITDEELKQIKDNYIKTISQRAADTVDQYDIEHTLTTNQYFEKEWQRTRDPSVG